VPLRYYAGNFRCIDSRHPCLAVNVHVSGVPGSIPADVPEHMRLLTDRLRSAEDELRNHLTTQQDSRRIVMAKLGMVAGILAIFIKTHPFMNGNGRISRLMANYLCYRHGLPMPFVDPSNRPPDNDYWQSMSLAMQGNTQMLWKYLFDAVVARITSGSITSDAERALVI